MSEAPLPLSMIDHRSVSDPSVILKRCTCTGLLAFVAAMVMVHEKAGKKGAECPSATAADGLTTDSRTLFFFTYLSGRRAPVGAVESGQVDDGQTNSVRAPFSQQPADNHQYHLCN